MEIKKELYKAKYTHITIKHTPKYTIQANWPDISDEENERRMKRIRESAVRLVLAADRANRKKKSEEAKRLEKERT